MTMKKVKVIYTGPGADDDPREMEVMDHEVENLVALGNWEVKKSSKKKEVKDA